MPEIHEVQKLIIDESSLQQRAFQGQFSSKESNKPTVSAQQLATTLGKECRLNLALLASLSRTGMLVKHRKAKKKM